jgi:hypothetical protein
MKMMDYETSGLMDQIQVLHMLPPGDHVTCGIRKQGGQV